MGERSLYNYVFFVDCIGDVATQDLHTGVFQFHIGKTAKKYLERICNILKDKQITFA
jgi:ABC-type phosphate/phosphonate transport system ATPase subunit